MLAKRSDCLLDEHFEKFELFWSGISRSKSLLSWYYEFWGNPFILLVILNCSTELQRNWNLSDAQGNFHEICLMFAQRQKRCFFRKGFFFLRTKRKWLFHWLKVSFFFFSCHSSYFILIFHSDSPNCHTFSKNSGGVHK